MGRRKIKEDRAIERNSFWEFTEQCYFNPEDFFRSAGDRDAPFYLFYGDMRENVFFISDNLKNEFGFQDNRVADLLPMLESRIHEGDRERFCGDIQEVLRERKENHVGRYRFYDRYRQPVWVYCWGKLQWEEGETAPLFFTEYMLLLNWIEQTDLVTGMRKLSGIGKKADVGGEEMMILPFFLNGFTDINYLLGYRAGDEILWEIGYGLKEALGEGFVLFRMEGMRFAVVSRTVLDPEGPVKKINAVVRKVYLRHGVNIVYPCTIGLLRSPRDGADIKTLTKNALAVLDKARQMPGCSYLEFTEEMARSEHVELDLEMALNDCVNREFEGLRIVIQPQVETENERIVGGEVLLRWNYCGQEISPSQFVPLLERTGLIVPVGKWVACQTLRICREILEIMPSFLISFNVSYSQILDDSFAPFLRERLEEYRIPGENLLVELTEIHSDTMPGQLEDFIQVCHELGIKFALDDYGTGYSSLQMLLHYPVDLIKLDRSLVKEIASSEKKKNFIMSIVYACHKFGKKVCAEGVEKKEELETVVQTECDYVQGFYYYKPRETQELYRILREQEKS